MKTTFKRHDLVNAKSEPKDGTVVSVSHNRVVVRWTDQTMCVFTKKEAREMLEHREMLA